jgi:5-formyltetrahydrofolate cyclo-ligase
MTEFELRKSCLDERAAITADALATKAELRRSHLGKRSAILPDERLESSRLIADRFFQTFDLSAVSYLHCFISIQKFNEVDTAPILERIWKKHPSIKTVAPQTDSKNGVLRHYEFAAMSDLSESTWGIREPNGQQEVPPTAIDLVVEPLLCFDRQGDRVGYGKGFYDKFLSQCRPDCIKVGLSIFSPVDRIIDVNDLDVRLDLCITPDEKFDFRSI